MMKSTAVIIVAGGAGSRMGSLRPKQFLFLGAEPILMRTINIFAASMTGIQIIVVLPPDQISFWRNLCSRFEIAPHNIAEGGAQRFDSVCSGLRAVYDHVEFVAIHDAVRPLVSKELIVRTFSAASEHDAVIPVVEVVDSLREVDFQSGDSKIIDRTTMRIVQTPQVFRADLLRQAYNVDFDLSFTDDASVVERMGAKIFLCDGERENLKITTPCDMTIANAIIEAREQATTEASAEAQANADAVASVEGLGQ